MLETNTKFPKLSLSAGEARALEAFDSIPLEVWTGAVVETLADAQVLTRAHLHAAPPPMPPVLICAAAAAVAQASQRDAAVTARCGALFAERSRCCIRSAARGGARVAGPASAPPA